MSEFCGVSAEIEDYSLEHEERVEGEHDRVCVREVTLIPIDQERAVVSNSSERQS